MPVLAIIYIMYLCWSMLDGLLDQLKERDPAWYIALDLIVGFVILCAFVSYWFRGNGKHRCRVLSFVISPQSVPGKTL